MLIVGCGGKVDEGPTCTQVTDHMLDVTKQQLVGHGDMELGQRGAMIAQCEQRKMSGEQRRCLMAAKDIPGIAACRAGKTDVLEKPRKPRPPAGSSS